MTKSSTSQGRSSGYGASRPWRQHTRSVNSLAALSDLMPIDPELSNTSVSTIGYETNGGTDIKQAKRVIEVRPEGFSKTVYLSGSNKPLVDAQYSELDPEFISPMRQVRDQVAGINRGKIEDIDIYKEIGGDNYMRAVNDGIKQWKDILRLNPLKERG